MKKFAQRLYGFSEYIACIFCLTLTALLFGSGFLYTCYSTDMDSQVVLTRWDNPLINALTLLLGIAVLLGISCRVCKKPLIYKRILLFAALFVCSVLGFALILFGRTMPAADAMSVFSIAQSFAGGEVSAIHPVDSYLSYYPQQIGLVAFFEPMIALWKLLPTNLAAYHGIKCIYVLLANLIIYTQYKTVHLLFQDDKTDCIYLLLAGTNLPLIMYSSFVYSEIPSFAALSGGLYYLLLAYKRIRQADFCNTTHYKNTRLSFSVPVAAVVLLSLSVLLRKNSLIVIIAVLLVLALEWARKPHPTLILLLLFIAVGSLSILPVTQKIYEVRGNNTLKSGVTATSYFAMGMQEASRGMGWYNGFNFYTYQGTGMDTKRTNEIAKEAIRERLTYFKENPGYAARFYWLKYLSQWTDGTYACRQATLANSGGRRTFMDSVYTGAAGSFVIEWCNGYQNILYLGSLLFAIGFLPKKRNGNLKRFDLTAYIGMIGVLGGFLFHMLWEANSRYIFLYGLLLLPYCAAGIANLGRKVCHLLKK